MLAISRHRPPSRPSSRCTPPGISSVELYLTVASRGVSYREGYSRFSFSRNRLGYSLAWEAFRTTGARVVPIPVDDKGLRVDRLEALLIQRLARQKLDEVAHGIVEDLEGDFEEENRPEWTYEVQVQNLSQDGADLLECTITVFYSEGQDLEPSEYTLSKWFFPDKESALLDLVGGSNTGGNQ